MFSKPMNILALLLALCMLTGCAAPAAEPAETADAEEAPVEDCSAEAAPTAEYAIASADMAAEAARAEIKKMQELGLLSDKLSIKAGEPDHVSLMEEPDFLDREDCPFYAVRWYGDSWYGNDWQGENRYSVAVSVDANTGKLMMVNIEASADENAEIKYEIPTELTFIDPETGEEEQREEIFLYHENFYDLFDEDMTLNAFCDLLCEYWGFEGWTLGGGGALDMSIPLRDISGGTSSNHYVAIDFEGDTEGELMYIQLSEFPGRVCLVFGTDHLKG